MCAYSINWNDRHDSNHFSFTTKQRNNIKHLVDTLFSQAHHDHQIKLYHFNSQLKVHAKKGMSFLFNKRMFFVIELYHHLVYKIVNFIKKRFFSCSIYFGYCQFLYEQEKKLKLNELLDRNNRANTRKAFGKRRHEEIKVSKGIFY